MKQLTEPAKMTALRIISSLKQNCCIILIGLLLAVNYAKAFQCYVCDSKNDIECMENLPNNLRLTPQDCKNITGAKYCIKTTNIYAGELGTKRFCAANDHGNYCKYIRQPTGDREYRSCVLTCDSENCNAARGLSSDLSLLIASSVTLIMLAIMIPWQSNY